MEQKFRVLKKTNKTIQQKLMALQPSGIVIELLEALGYTYLDDEMHAFAGDYFQTLMEGSSLIDAESMKLKKNNMTPEERKKQELIEKNQAEYKAKMKAEAQYKKEMAHLSDLERKVK